MKLSFALFYSAAFFGSVLSAQLSVPRAGLARFADQSLRVVRGIPASLIVDQTPVGTATAASFSDSGGLIAENGKIDLLSPDGSVIAQYECSETAPILNADGPLNSVLAWLPSERAILSWSGTSFSITRLQVAGLDGQVTSIRRTRAETAELLIAHADGAVSATGISLRDGTVLGEDYLPGVHGRAFFQQGWIISITPYGLSVDGSNHRELRLSDKPLPPADITIERMSSDWLHVYSAGTGQDWALYLSAREMNLSWLPTVGVSR